MAWVDARDYVPADMLIVDVDWAPDSGGVVYQVQDREQTWLDLNVADAGIRPLAPPLPRDDEGVGQCERQPDLAQGRVVPLVQRTQRVQAPVPLPRRRHARPAGHGRPLGDPIALRRGRSATAWSTSTPAPAVTSTPTSTASASTAPGMTRLSTHRRNAPRHLQSLVLAIHRRVERRGHADAGPPASRRRDRGARDRRQRGRSRWRSTGCRSRSSSK